jgi:hypothetical protein
VTVDAYTPTSNGCGPDIRNALVNAFSQAIGTDWARPCCDEHDLCFGACNSDFTQCNTDFHNCLNRRCIETNDIGCAILVPVYVAAVSSAIGCNIFTTPNPGCSCPPTTSTQQRTGQYAQYHWNLDQYTTHIIRSRYTDTNTILMGVDINGVPSAGGEIRSFQGDQPAGRTFRPGLEIDFWAFDTDAVTLWLSIYNGDLSPPSLNQLNKANNILNMGAALDLLAQTTEAIATAGLRFVATLVGGSRAGILAGDLLGWIWGNRSCDGWVVLRVIHLNGSQLASEGLQNSLEEGYESPMGCKANSRYGVSTRYGLKREGGVVVADVVSAATTKQHLPGEL